MLSDIAGDFKKNTGKTLLKAIQQDHFCWLLLILLILLLIRMYTSGSYLWRVY